MKPNLWMYSTPQEMSKTAASLIVFGSEVFKSAKVVKDICLLEQLLVSRNNNTIPSDSTVLKEYFFDYLIDCVKIVVFFENYMKAELISLGFCVHQINRGLPKFKDLATEQRKRPINNKEIYDIEPFETNESEKTIFHMALKETTLGFSDLIKPAYVQYYRFDNTTLNHIKELNLNRNNLHFHDSIKFELSTPFIDQIKNLNYFVDLVVGHFILPLN